MTFMGSLHKINIYTFMYHQEKSGLTENCRTHVVSHSLDRGQMEENLYFRGWRTVFLCERWVNVKRLKIVTYIAPTEIPKVRKKRENATFNNIAIMIKTRILPTRKSLDSTLGQPCIIYICIYMNVIMQTTHASMHAIKIWQTF